MLLHLRCMTFEKLFSLRRIFAKGPVIMAKVLRSQRKALFVFMAVITGIFCVHNLVFVVVYTEAQHKILSIPDSLNRDCLQSSLHSSALLPAIAHSNNWNETLSILEKSLQRCMKYGPSRIDAEILRNASIDWTRVRSNEKSLCPRISPLLEGKIKVVIGDSPGLQHAQNLGGSSYNWPPTFEEIALRYSSLSMGGVYMGPHDCVCRNALAVIVPYRDREVHLRYFLYYIHQILQRQQHCYIVIVVEQSDNSTFNKGQLMNAGFMYAQQLMKFDCFIFHDVDMMAENDRIPYTCRSDYIVHIAPYVSKFNYTYKKFLTVGGASAYTEEQFTKLNGYSNEFEGWGGEDDEMMYRIKHMKLKIWRTTDNVTSRFKMIKHEQDKRNPTNPYRMQRRKLASSRMATDGLNSLASVPAAVTRFPSHTRILLRTHESAYNRERDAEHAKKGKGKKQMFDHGSIAFDLSAFRAHIEEMIKLKRQEQQQKKKSQSL